MGIPNYTVVSVAANSTTVHTGPGILYGATVNTILSAHVLPIQDGTAILGSFVATAPVGTQLTWPNGVKFNTSLVVDPNDAATGDITVVWEAL